MKRKSKSILKCIMTFVLTVVMVMGAIPLPQFTMVAQAATTTSITTVGGTDYTLYTGFTATAGTKSYANFVDGNTSTKWQVMKSMGENAWDFAGGEEDPAFVEFHTDAPFIPKGYILTYDNTYNENWKPTSWALKAKLNESDNWTTIHSSNSSLGNGSRFEIACNNDGDNMYQYFRFEIYDVGTTYQSILNELEFYGNTGFIHLTPKVATCTETGIKQECWYSNGKYFSDMNGTTELDESAVVEPMKAHTRVHHEASATNTEYWQCSVCGKYFSDEACTNEILEAETLIGVFGAIANSRYTLTSQTYTLTDDVNTAGYIYVPADVTATIDLAGYTIDRGLTSEMTNGSVIIVEGTLTITDSSTGGKVQGGYDAGDGYAYTTSCVKVLEGATFNLQGGTLIGRVQDYDYTVSVVENSYFTMTGGKITGGWTGVLAFGNVTLTGGEISGNNMGVRVGENFSISGNPVITNNTKANVMILGSWLVINVVGALTDGANIGITATKPTDNAPVTVTSGYGTYNSEPVSTYFSLDNDGQIQTSSTDYMTVVMGWNEDRTEVAVGKALYTVNFDMNGHGDAIDAVSLLSGYKLMKPEPTADGWYFFGWYTGATCTTGNEYDFDNAVTSNMTLHALWTQEAIYSFTLPEKMVIVSTTNAPVGGKYPVGTVIKFKAAPDYVVDGDVSDGTNTLSADGDDIYTVTMGDADITITATVKKAVEPNKTLSGSESYTANDGDVLTGSTSGTVTIANNAKITLSDVTITGGIVCAGTATITLVGTNSVSGATNKAGIQVGGSGTTLTIKGNGSLTANGGARSAGIGLSRAWDVNATGGDIVIEGGNITATGDDYGAGIGTGVSWGDTSDKTATIGNITIKGGSVRAIGGTNTFTPGSGIGKGGAYSYGHAVVGTITIYDGIDMVDASSISESVTYMHVDNETETNVTASKSDYFTITDDGDRRVITPKDDTDYTITIANGIEHGSLTGAATAKYMEKVTITATPDFGYRLSRLVVKDAQNNDVASTGNSFFMPKSNVTVSAEFEQGVHGTTEFAWGYNGQDGFVTEATIFDGVTTVELQQGQSYRILKYDESSYRKFFLDNDIYNVTIPYSGGTGTLTYGNVTKFRVDYNGESGYYDITMTDAGNGKWSVSILKTVGVIDNIPDQTYTGSAITPEPTVIAGSLSLTKGTDYEYSYTDNTNVGTAKVTVTFKGDYASLGSVEKEFNIFSPHTAPVVKKAPKAITGLVYNGTAQALVEPGEAENGTMVYAVTKAGDPAPSAELYTTSNYTATNAGSYYVYYMVIGDDSHHDIDGGIITVTIAPSSPVINTSPADVKVIRGSKATFRVNVTGEDLSFRWETSKDGENWKKSSAEGSDTNKLSFTATENLNGRYYRCVVSNDEGEVTSEPALLTTVSNIASQPKKSSGTIGSEVTFSVKARSSASTYQWQISTDGGESWKTSSAAGNTSSSIKVKVNSAKYNGYLFRCKVTNGSISEFTNAALLSVKAEITKQPENVKQYYGNLVKFYVKATGVDPKYQWLVKNASGKWVKSTAPGNDSNIITFTATSTTNGREFRCMITDGDRTIYSNIVSLTSVSNILTQPKAVSVKVGNAATFTIKATGTKGELFYNWQYSADGGKTWKYLKFSGYDTEKITISKTKAEQNGYLIRCRVKNRNVITYSNVVKLSVK